jgi:NTE family protein
MEDAKVIDRIRTPFGSPAIYRSKHYDGHAKDYEFSRLSMQEHWRAGYHDAVRTLRHPEALHRPHN